MTGPILCVDDEPSNLAILRAALKDHFPLTFARNGGETLNALEKHAPALILLDVEMPDMSGYEVCRQIKLHPQSENTPVIFVTSLSALADEQAGFDAGGVDYITKPISPAIVLARVRTHLSLVRATVLEQSYRDAIYMLGEAGHYNDNDTGVHIWRMAAYAKALAAACGWSSDACQQIELAAPMHDTGKIGVPDSILKKPGPLDASEWIVMKTHAQIGHDILSKSEAPVFRMAAEIALHHHERWDGSGYPRALAREAIPESARIVAIADVFDALSMRRPYKKAWPLEQTLTTMKESVGSHFEPRLFEIFMHILPEILAIQETWNAREPEPGNMT